MIPLFIPSHFGEHYQVLAQGHVSFSSGEVVTTTDAARLFSIITRELTIPAEQWRGVLIRFGISIPPNFFHAADIYHELVKLFQRRQLQLVKIPRLEQLPTIKAEEGWGYCFTFGPHRHPSLSYSPVVVNSLQDAQALLSNIKISEKELSRLLRSNLASSTENLAELLANHSVIAYKIPVPTAAPSVKPLEFLPAAAADKPVPLAPESSPAASGSKEPQRFELAKTEGSSDQQIAARKEIAYLFYEQQGMPPSKIAGHTAGIDFSKPVEVISLPIGKTVNQYQIPGGAQGNYYAEPGISPTELGISQKAKDWKTGNIVAKEVNVYETNAEVEVLRSTAAKIDDTWSIPNEVVKTCGGASQYFTMRSGRFSKK